MAENFRERIPGTPRFKRDKDIPTGTEPFFPNFLLKEWIVGALFIVAFILWVVFNPVGLEKVANPEDTSFIPVPDWYFLFLYQLLKYFPGKYVVMGTVVIPAIATIGLLLLPWLDRRKTRRPFQRPITTATMVLTVFFMIWLTYVAEAQHQAELAAQGPQAQTPGSQGGGTSGPLVDPNDPGAQIFSQSCASCHGANLEGAVGPKLLGIGNKMNETQLVDYINNPQPVAGYPHIMPPKGGLQADDQVKQVAAWLAKQKQK